MHSTYDVTGMTCAHCVRAVSTELSRVAGVQDVTVDLPGGHVTLTSDRPVDAAAVAAAVDAAGYALAG
jgi:copper chaperone CopZ